MTQLSKVRDLRKGDLFRVVDHPNEENQYLVLEHHGCKGRLLWMDVEWRGPGSPVTYGYQADPDWEIEILDGVCEIPL